MLTDAGVKASHKLDLIYKSISKNKMNFTDFLNSLVKVAEFYFFDVVDDSTSALTAFLDHHLLPLAESIIKPQVS